MVAPRSASGFPTHRDRASRRRWSSHSSPFSTRPATCTADPSAPRPLLRRCCRGDRSCCPACCGVAGSVRFGCCSGERGVAIGCCGAERSRRFGPCRAAGSRFGWPRPQCHLATGRRWTFRRPGNPGPRAGRRRRTRGQLGSGACPIWTGRAGRPSPRQRGGERSVGRVARRRARSG